MIEDRKLILRVLRHRRVLLHIMLGAGSAPKQKIRFELSRVNAEIGRRCWNRIADHAAQMHSPIED